MSTYLCMIFAWVGVSERVVGGGMGSCVNELVRELLLQSQRNILCTICNDPFFDMYVSVENGR